MEEIIFVDMPFSDLSSPSLALGILQASLNRAEIPARTYYANLLFWQRYLPEQDNLVIVSYMIHGVGELAFFSTFFPNKTLTKDEVLAVLPQDNSNGIVEKLFWYYEQFQIWIPEFIEQFANEIVEQSPKIVACTSTLSQHLSTLALLRRIKELRPETATLIGGANLEAELGIANHRYFPYLDYVFSGDADAAVVPLVQAILNSPAGTEIPAEKLPEGTLGPVHRHIGYPPIAPRCYYDALDDNPIPEYRDYFKTLAECPKLAPIKPIIFYESSRGCRWGASGGCKFCGLNGKQHQYRLKKPEKVIADLKLLSQRHNLNGFEMTDNMVPPEYFDTLFPELIRLGSPYRLFYETRASASREYYQRLREAGVVALQPGIENLSTPVLKHINKGIQSWQAIQCLKWSRLYGFFSSWHVMWGFPNEQEDWYEPLVTLIPKLFHLQHPQTFNQMQYCRFSEFWKQFFPSGKLRPDGVIGLAFAFEHEVRNELSYNFRTEQPIATDSVLFQVKLPRLVAEWIKQFAKFRPEVTSIPDGSGLQISDTRPQLKDSLIPDVWIPFLFPQKKEYVFNETERSMLEECDAAPLEKSFLEKWGKSGSNFLNENEKRNLVLRIDGRVLSLVLPSPLPYQPLKLSEAFHRVDRES